MTILWQIVLEEILHQLIGSLSHYLQGFIHPRRCRISSIHCMTLRTVNIILIWPLQFSVTWKCLPLYWQLQPHQYQRRNLAYIEFRYTSVANSWQFHTIPVQFLHDLIKKQVKWCWMPWRTTSVVDFFYQVVCCFRYLLWRLLQLSI